MTKNLPASVRQRLTNKAKESNRPFQEVLQYFAMERFLYRLAQSQHADKFVLKGALMFTAWGGPASRPTRDIDLPARMDMTRRVTRIFASENIKDVGCKMGAKWVQYWPFEPSTTTM